MEPLEQEGPNDLTEDDTVKLGPANYVNAGMFFVSFAVLFVAEWTKWLGGHLLEEQTKKHWTILAPMHTGKSTSTLIWYGIGGFELLFVLAQLTPMYRVHQTVKDITPWFILSCTFQTAFVIAVMYEVHITIPSGLVLANFVTLMTLIGFIEGKGKRSFLEYWLLRAPFSVHAGHMFCLSIQYLNVLLQMRPDNHAGVVVATSATGLTAVLTLTVAFAVAIPRPDGLFSAAVAWTYYWVFYELALTPGNPDSNLRQHLNATVVTDEVVEAFSSAAAGICFISICLVILSFGLRGAACCQKGRVL